MAPIIREINLQWNSPLFGFICLLALLSPEFGKNLLKDFH